MPHQKSVYSHFLDPWFYKTGVFDGKFVSLIGQGSSGTVISGEWAGKKAAFKFVEVGSQQWGQRSSDLLETLGEKPSEMTSTQATKGSKIVSFYAHYR